ncbi:MAG: hypothetical protein J6U54_11240 [Clostridiales bacterium]|nr:hypothetical protein [Clostridiales bacterium]
MNKEKAQLLAEKFEALYSLMNEVREDLDKLVKESEFTEGVHFLADVLYGELKISFPEAQQWFDDIIYTLKTGEAPEVSDEEDEP